MEFKDYVRIVLAHWLGVVLLILVGLGGAVAYNLTQPQVYQASATGIVSLGKTSSTADASIGDSLAKSKATSYAAIATSTKTAQQVVKNTGSSDSPEVLLGKITVSQPLDTVLITVERARRRPGAGGEAGQRLGHRTLAGGRAARERRPRHRQGRPAPAVLRQLPGRLAGAPAHQPQPRARAAARAAARLRLRAGPPPVRPPTPVVGGGREAVRRPRDRADARSRRRCGKSDDESLALAVTGSPSASAVPARPRRSASCAPTSPTWTSTTRRGSSSSPARSSPTASRPSPPTSRPRSRSAASRSR